MDNKTLKTLRKDTPFDQYSRQYQVATTLNELRRNNETFTVLDVGGYKGKTAEFLAADTVTVLDLFNVKEKNYVRGSALEMPFDAASFDFVVSFDVLEHIPAEFRDKFVTECSRVAKRGVIICAPQKKPANEYAEKALNSLYAKLHHKPHRWLREHIAYGIPDFSKIEVQAKSLGMHPVKLHSNKVQLWVAMQEAIFIHSKFATATEQLMAVNNFYNEHFEYDGGGTEEAAYRLILCCFKSGGDRQIIEKRLGNHNMPIDPSLEIKLYEKLGEFYAMFAKKTNTLTNNYKELYEHEHTRSNTFEENNKQLVARLSNLESRLGSKIRAHLKSVKNKE